VQAGDLETRGHVRIGIDLVVHGLGGEDLHPDQFIDDFGLLFRRQHGRRLATRNLLQVEIIVGPGDDLAVDGGDAAGLGGRRVSGGLLFVAGGERQGHGGGDRHSAQGSRGNHAHGVPLVPKHGGGAV